MPGGAPVGARHGTTERNFNFEFSLPIQDTFPHTRDPNRFPVGAMSDNHFSTTMLDSRPSSLTTVNVDVQNHIMSFLSISALSALMSTCRYFLDAALLPLCSHSGDLLCDDDLTRVPSFRLFLRINGGPSSRAHLIKELWISVTERALVSSHHFHGHYNPVGEQWTAAFVDILRHCHNVRRLRIDEWLYNDISFSLLVHTIASSLHRLEELTVYMDDHTETSVLRKLARLPLRKLSFLKHHDVALGSFPAPLDGLPRTLTELEVHAQMPTSARFPAVWGLGMRGMGSGTFVAHAMAAFPNITLLILRRLGDGDRLWHLNVVENSQDDLARMNNRDQWQSAECDGAWPSLSAIWTEDLSELYCAGFSRHVSSISIPFRSLGEESYVGQVLEDTCPSFLELRTDLNDLDRAASVEWPEYFGPSISSVRRLTVLMHAGHFGDGGQESRISPMLDNLCFGILPLFTSLTHLLLRFEHTYSPSSPLDRGLFAAEEARGLRTTIGQQEALLRSASTSLRWIGFELRGCSLESLEVSYVRAGENGEAAAIWTKMDESAGLVILKREGMNAFRDVVPSICAVH